MTKSVPSLPIPKRNLNPFKISVKGKFLYCGTEKFYVKGVTYGTFAPDELGHQFPEQPVVEKDFMLMAQQGINCVRVYTVPPRFLLDLAAHYNLFVMVGLPWEQHITFLDDPKRQTDIIRRVKEGVQACSNHPAVLCYAIGNEIPAPIVRWYGKRKIETFLKKLYRTVKDTDPQSLVTYVNYPTTEYLDLSFLDFDCFNVYLETPEKLQAYISRLHNLSGGRPLVLAEIGLDSMRNGLEQQALTLRWQVETIFAKGCAGIFVFAWTDQWWRGGCEIEDWDFGIVDRQRNAKPALHAVCEVFEQAPFFISAHLPFISVVVCSYNGAATIRDTLEGLQRLKYSHYEVIVVNDGSKDNLAAVVAEYPVKLISTPNRGLSNARNTGLYEARGEIVAYIDDDAYPDEHWLHYLAYAFLHTPHAGIGGPNLVPAEDGPVARCVANSPGGPVHVLVTDEIAEHIPGCNMAFRRDVLLEVGGFDPLYRAAGDDVDVCWRIQATGRTIGFHPAALVWHHRRSSIKAYWKQQQGYGKAEALLEQKWPEKYNAFGHLTWAGRIYGNGFTLPIKTRKGKVYHGTWGTALFQSVYAPAEGFLNAMPLMPEWYLFSGLLGLTALLGLIWPPLLWTWFFFAASLLLMVLQAIISAHKNVSWQSDEPFRLRYRLLIIGLHLVQPVARLKGRLKHGLTPWRRKVTDEGFLRHFSLGSQKLQHWSEEWRATESWLEDVERFLIARRTRVRRSGVFDRWDLQVRNSLAAVSHCMMTVEEHGGGKQLLRFKVWSRPSNVIIFLFTSFALLTIAAFTAGVTPVASVLCLASFAFVLEYIRDAAAVSYCLQLAITSLNPDDQKAAESTIITNQVPDEEEAFPSYRRVMMPRSSFSLNGEQVTSITETIFQEKSA